MKNIIGNILFIYFFIAFFVLLWGLLENCDLKWEHSVGRAFIWLALFVRGVYRGIKEIW